MPTYLLSWTCYGQWIHGDQRGSVDEGHNLWGEPWLPADEERHRAERASLDQPPYSCDLPRRLAVRQAILGVCAYRGWEPLALHVRVNHVHIVVSGDAAPERMLNDFKAYASRELNASGLDMPGRKRWTRHGSTRYVFGVAHRESAVRYVLHKQGKPMERFPEDSPDSASPGKCLTPAP